MKVGSQVNSKIRQQYRVEGADGGSVEQTDWKSGKVSLV